MKKLFLGMALIALLFPSCESDQNPVVEQEAQIDMSDFYVYTDADVDETAKSNDNSKLANSRTCYTMANLNRLLNENPGLEKKMYDIEYQTRKFIASKGKPGGGGSGGGTVDNKDYNVDPINDGFGTIIIPVNVIIVYPNANVISDAQIQSQIDVLNADFSNRNVDSLPDGTTFANDATDTEIQFTWNGIAERHDDRTKFWGTNDAVKFTYPPTDPENQLNIWVCSISRSILGYAQFPGGNLATDGIVIGGDYFGITSGAYGLGRTATHEVGHYLNLRHIWGDGGCSQDDFVFDTPISDRSNGGCPPFPTVHCNTPDMTMNYMDYTYDNCMYMFTDGQRNRMRAIFASNGPRAAMQ
jgi:hypothetical protein